MLLTIKKKLLIMACLCLLMVAGYIINTALDSRLLVYGIFPGDIHSLLHFYTAPFLHGNLSHLTNNLTGFVIFGWLCLMRGIPAFLLSSLVIVTLSGLLIWLFGRPAYHIGASGWIFGLWSLSIAIAWFDRNVLNIALALGVAFLYGGMIYGVLPNDPGLSWEAHLFGAVSGVVAAWLLAIEKNRSGKSNKLRRPHSLGNRLGR